MNSNVISTLQRNINIEWGGRGEPTDIAQKIAYRSTIFGHTEAKGLSQIPESNFHQLWVTVQLKIKNIKIYYDLCNIQTTDCALNCFEDYFKPSASYIQALTISMNQPIFFL